jgi:putative N6-adenine-specific DNA methylase
MDFFATAAKGTEAALRDELREGRFRSVRADRGGVHFSGGLEEGYRACIELRTAVRVLLLLSEFDAGDGEALYEGVRAIAWSPYLTPRHTLAVRAACRSSGLTHTQFIAQKTKDAVVDQIRDKVGERPSVDLEDPDVMLFVHLVRDRASVYLDLAGEPLHRRGYRTHIGEAPLKETLAAAILRLGGWDREAPLIDPMCGSGTFAIEATMWARRIAPGLARDRFGFERWASHGEAEAKRAADLRAEARARIVPKGPRVTGFDKDPQAIETARGNARRAGLAIRFDRRAIHELKPEGEAGMVVTNPPYGERLEGTWELYDELGAALRRMHNHGAAVLAGDPAILRAIPLRPEKSLIVWNGPIECRLLRYSIP